MPRVATVKDNPDNRRLARVLLDGLTECDAHENGMEAPAGLEARVPDMVLLDISLPGLDGVETLKRFRAVPALADLHVLALTAHAMTGDRERLWPSALQTT